ncbi:prolipoprotein diacylglyceryl transferase [Patescibacteria group bacterium]
MTFEKFSVIPIGPIQIQVWGLLVALGMLVALLFTLREAKRKKMRSEPFIDIFILSFIASIIGSRLLYVAIFWDNYKDNLWKIVQINEGGLVFLGGVLLVVLTIILYTRFKKLKFWKVADAISPGFALGIGIGRIGCYLIGDHIGSRTNLFLGSYYNGDLRHEPSLYLSINGFILFLLLFLLRPFIRTQGVMAYIFIVWYSASRFLLDFTRAMDIEGLSDPRYFNLTISQWLSLALFVIFLPLLIHKIARAKAKK